MEMTEYKCEPIGVVHSCFSEKFGIPRQPGLAKHAVAQLELFSRFGREEMLRELDQFSHIWINFIFHKVIDEGWRATVRPPWLGGQKRVGVFASRTPHRPNHLGLSAVRLEGIRWEKKKVFLDISGVDLLDQTPVVDIRPYLPYSDIIPDACGGYGGQTDGKNISVEFTEVAELFCLDYSQKTGRSIRELLVDVLTQDPRPASQRRQGREFGVLLWDVNTRFVFESDAVVRVIQCELT